MFLSYIYIILAAVSWATVGVFGKYLSYTGFSSLQISLIRSVFSLVAVGIFLLVRDRKAFKIDLRDSWLFLLTGIFSNFFCNLSYFQSIKLNGVAIAAVLMYTAPVFVLVASVLIFKEKLTGKKVLALILAVLGCACVSGVFSVRDEVSLVGILWGICSGLAYASYSIFSVFALKKYSPFTVIFYTFAVSAAAALIAQPSADVSAVFVGFSDMKCLLLSIGLGVVSTAIPFSCFTVGLLRVEPSKASIIATIEPVIAAVFGLVLFSEKLSFITVLGILLVISASFVINSRFKRDDC